MISTNVETKSKVIDFPMYMPKIGDVAWKIIYFQIKTLHGGVTLTMTAVRDQYWIQLTEIEMTVNESN